MPNRPGNQNAKISLMFKKKMAPVVWAVISFKGLTAPRLGKSPISLDYWRLKLATNLASYFHLGFFRSEELETAVELLANRIAEQYKSSLSRPKAKAGGTLHIVSKAYASGGHTRVLERWIESSDPNVMTHSILLTRDQNIPKTLNSVTNLTSITIIPGKGLSHVLELASQFLSFESLVGHIHPNDVDAVLAFHIFKQMQNFGRVALFNHADHRFWLGVNTADVILEFRSFGQALTKLERLSDKSVIVGLPFPSSPKIQSSSSQDFRTDVFTLITVGRGHKYSRVPGEPSFEDFVDRLLGSNPNFNLTIVGPSRWSRLTRFHFVNRKRIQFLGTKSLQFLQGLYSQHHVGIDSFPMAGATVATEMSLSNLPVVSLRGAVGLVDSLPRENWFVAENYEDWEKSVIKALELSHANKVKAEVKPIQQRWGAKVDALLISTPRPKVSATIDQISVNRLEAFLWATEPRLKNILSGRVL